jgi:hypothetical protein
MHNTQEQRAVCEEYHRWVLRDPVQAEDDAPPEGVAPEHQPGQNYILRASAARGADKEAVYQGAQPPANILDHADGDFEDFHMPGVELRPFQVSALDVILRARRTGVTQNRVATAAIVAPTSAGKDLLPLALARYCRGTSVVFVPHVCVYPPLLTITPSYSCCRHLLESAAKEARQFGGTAEPFDDARMFNNSAADVVVCSYEHASQVCTCVCRL